MKQLIENNLRIRRMIKRKADCMAVLIISRHFKRLLLKQFKIKSKFRNKHNKAPISRVYKSDQWIGIDYTFQIIKCKHCDRFAKAPLKSKRNCYQCLNHRLIDNARHQCYEWQSWGICD